MHFWECHLIMNLHIGRLGMEYIEREWHYLRKAWEYGILREWFRVVAYCPSCQTSLSNAEIKQGYAAVKDPSLYYKVK